MTPGRWIAALVLIAFAIAPLFAGNFTVSLLNDIGIGALVALGLVLLTGVGGATSFGQAAFVGNAAYATAWLTTAQGLSPWLGLLFALLLTGLSALAIGVLTLRLGGHFLPLSTIAWGLSIAMVFGNVDALGRHTGISNIPALSIGAWSLADRRMMYYLIWTVVGLSFLFSQNLLQSRPGRAIRSLRGGATLLASVGADAYRVRLSLFVIAALLAGFAGWLYAHTNRFVSPSPFDVRASIEYLLMAVAGGLGHLVGALVGSALVLSLKNALQDVLPLLTQRAGQLEAVAFATLFILLLHFARGGLMGYLVRWHRRRRVGRAPRASISALREPVEPLPHRQLPARGTPILSVKGAVKRFGGLVAVNEVSFDLAAGEILGLIGPNGAGKSTMFNLLTCTLPMTAGSVRFLDRAHELAGSLPLGTQRILEIARALAADPVLLVLDEPAAGLRRKEKMALAELLRKLREEGVTILIVEHDMDFVMKLVDRLVVMNFGSKLVEGPPAAVRADERVQAAYLGSVA